MQRSCRRITGLIEDLLDFARGRLGAGLVVDRRPAIDLEKSLRQVLDELQIVHQNRQIELRIALDEAVTCDAERITQLLSNLLANALTHGAPDTPVTVEATSAEGKFVLSVSNAGMPIPATSIPQLFQPFTRAGDEQLQEGLGLGLFIASEIAKAHQGAIGVTSDDSGTCFTLSMPCTCSE